MKLTDIIVIIEAITNLIGIVQSTFDSSELSIEEKKAIRDEYENVKRQIQMLADSIGLTNGEQK